MNETLISVIVPIYNMEKYIRTCIMSLLNQTYDNLDIILINDGSTDSSEKICKEFLELDNRVRYYVQSNKGLSAARNLGISHARGEYIGFVDADDWVSVQMYETLYSNLVDNSADISVCERVLVTETGLDNKGKTGAVHICNTEQALDILYQDKKYMSYAWNKLFRIELFQGIRFPVGKNYEDIYIMHELYGKASKIVFSDTGLYYYRKRQSSITANTSISNFNNFIDAVQMREKSSFTYGREKSIFLHYYYIANVINNIYYYEKNKDIISVKRRIGKILFKRISIKNGFWLNIKACFVITSFPIKSKLTKIVRILNKYRKKIFDTQGTFIFSSARTRIILMGSPEYNNLGDLAIAFSIKNFIEENFPKIEYLEIPEKILLRDFFPKGISESDILCLMGGGNFGDEYMDQETIRKRVLERYPNNNIIMFPQTYYFTETGKGKKELEDLRSILNKNDKTTLFARDYISYELMKKNLPIEQIRFAPDMVLYRSLYYNDNRRGILLCLRSDAESILEQSQRETILNNIYGMDKLIDIWDTCLNRNIALQFRDSEVEKAIRYIAQHRIIITDRLHGMIFAAVSGTPCVCINNYNHKLSSVYEYLKELDYIKLVENINDIKKIGSGLIKKYPKGNTYRLKKSLFDSLINEFYDILGE